MRVVILGGGTVGRVLGVRLAHTGVAVTFVVRTPLPSRLTIERVDNDESLTQDPVTQSADLPESADVILVCLPAEAMDEEMLARLVRATCPIITLFPLLPNSWSRIADALGDRAVPGLPSVIGYVREDGIARYWLPRVVPTSIDSSANDLSALIDALTRSGVPAELSHTTARDNQVVTATLLPMAMGLAVRGSVSAAMDDDDLLALVFHAMTEMELLARDLGPAPPWLGMLTKFIGPRMLKVGVGIAERTSAEALRYVDVHFGKSRVPSTRALADETLAVCKSRNISMTSFAALRARMPP